MVLLGGVLAVRGNAQTLEATLHPADPAEAQLFGQAVSLQGDVAVVGATGAMSNTGAAYVFRRTLSVWAQELKLTPVDLGSGDLFGASTALTGDLIAVGAPDSLDVFGGGSRSPGSVYVFRDTGGTWPQQAKLMASDGSSFDQLGRSVAAQGVLVVAGAPGDQASGDGAPNGGLGAAYVFRFNGVSWNQEAKLVAAHPGAGDMLGQSVALDGDVIAVGSPGYDNLSSNSGAVLVFRFNAGAWVFETRLIATDPAAGDNFGAAVAVSDDGDLIAVGAPKDNQGFSDTGAVYVFRFNGVSWAQQVKLVASDAGAQGQLGTSLSLQAPLLLAGAPGAAAGHGKGYLFADNGTNWFQHTQLAPAASLFCGQGVALDGSAALLGAPWTSNGSLLFAGDASVFEAFVDCNANALPDDLDIDTGVSLDCNGNDVPDECDIASGFSLDCNDNGVPDECDLTSSRSLDCNDNDVPDECDIASGFSLDCNDNGIPDECDLASGFSLDCNDNDVPDECDLTSGFSLDCDENGVPDECDPDLNRNQIPDACEGTWANLGHALAGVSGAPVLVGEGTLIASLSVTLTLSNARPNSQTALFVGISSIFAPFKGGVFVPAPTIAIFGLPTGALGVLPLTAHWPAGLPPSFTMYFQHWITDSAAPGGLSASNGLSGTTPP